MEIKKIFYSINCSDMKRIAILFLILPMFLSCNSKKTDANIGEKNTDTIITAIDTLTTDKVTKPTIESFAPYFVEQKNGNVLWIQAKNALSPDQEGMYLYFQNDNGVAKNIRLRIQYGDNTSYKIVCDGKTYNYKANKTKTSDSRFVDGGFNWYDDYVKRDDLKFLETLESSNDSKIIFSDGQTIEINKSIKSNIKKTLEYFEAMDGLLPKSNMVNIRRL